jgi:hypothetical protein
MSKGKRERPSFLIGIKVESHSFVIGLLLPGRLCLANVGRDLLATRASEAAR